MSDDAAPKPKKKGKMKLIIMVVGGLVLVGGGVAGGMVAAGMGLGGAHAGPKVDPNAPKLVLRPGQSEDPTVEFKAVGSFQPDPRLYKASYYTMDQPFTSNLRDTDGIAQISLGVSTFYDAKVLDNFKDNEMPIRSAVLETLADQDAFALGTPEGKTQLQAKLKDAMNKVLVQKTGYGGIDDVYFTNFIIQ
ncbi:flagellar basal body-associated FliL family protein [Sphingomonas sp. CGMCC 1.13654]|uniref:Flagellar protein FliL n=1 Tax=Sphingomonas chungangi TaxID=2683589 RepID=A0A838L0D0_9SPHN|nr:flagellar basal body-associated FliL family protein [Sphingomonas chungangi]MBA2932953.1 flagellar basal body-associated FliL family protein [Sphingomonas chungangi]MVW56573.1 flagellar basal body protein FliL [Sphingomonas chungangi]